jgi:hypothetical protein
MDDKEPADENTAKKKAKQPVCIICSDPAEFCVRGVPEDSYCKECASELFQTLDDLDRIE